MMACHLSVSSTFCWVTGPWDLRMASASSLGSFFFTKCLAETLWRSKFTLFQSGNHSKWSKLHNIMQAFSNSRGSVNESMWITVCTAAHFTSIMQHISDRNWIHNEKRIRPRLDFIHCEIIRSWKVVSRWSKLLLHNNVTRNMNKESNQGHFLANLTGS